MPVSCRGGKHVGFAWMRVLLIHPTLELEWLYGVHDPCVHAGIGSQSYSSALSNAPGQSRSIDRKSTESRPTDSDHDPLVIYSES
ncbi:hypothetical protein VNO77_02468 [Canavalia gladiata]|uniref:Uncharacterized protein n=1 Tax=Canavalia gladiata TaxID=3824 RepID=A0AAN9MZK0_CANGL